MANSTTEVRQIWLEDYSITTLGRLDQQKDEDPLYYIIQKSFPAAQTPLNANIFSKLLMATCG